MFYSAWYDVHCSAWYLRVSVVCGIMCIVVYDDARIVVCGIVYDWVWYYVYCSVWYCVLLCVVLCILSCVYYV